MTNEPTTGEIVRDLRLKTKYGMELTNGDFPESAFVTTLAADRLESQEATIAELTRKDEWAGHACDHMINKLRDEVRELTARAESAERERDAAIADLKNAPRCSVCDHQDCKYCTGNDMFTWRGLQPQEGWGNERG